MTGKVRWCSFDNSLMLRLLIEIGEDLALIFYRNIYFSRNLKRHKYNWKNHIFFSDRFIIDYNKKAT